MESTASSTTGYVTGLFGKWHLGTSDDQDNYDAPASAGYSNFSALFLDKQDSPSATGAPYFKFTITRDGTPNPVDTDYDAKIGHPTEEDKEIYATQLIIDDAIDWISDRETNGDSYFAYIPFFSPHDPVHCPFEGSGTAYPNGDFECTGEGTLAFDEQFRSMIETVDIEIERLLDETTTDPLVIIVSDNGTDSEDLDVDPWSSNKAKGTVGQGGVLVPFIAFGATVQEDVVIEDSVNLNDLYATILDFAGKSTLTPSPTDSQSLKDLLTGVSSTAPHEFNYTETFYPNFDPGSDFGPCRGVQAVQEDPGEYATSTFKYLRVLDGQSALYDLDEDPVEDDNLISSPPDANRLADLEYYIDTTLDSDLASICDDSLLKPIDGDCDEDADCCSNNCSEATDKCICPAP